MAILVLAEHNNAQLKHTTHHTLTAAKRLPGEITVLVAGSSCQAVAEEAAALEGVKQVLLAEHSCYERALAENMAALVLTLAQDYDYLLAPASTFGKNIWPRVAACLNVVQLSDITAIIDATTFQHPIYAGNALETVQLQAKQKVLTVRTTAFPAADTPQASCAIVAIDTITDKQQSRFMTAALSASTRPELTSARVVVAGGRGLQSAANFALLEALADQLQAAVGASRAAVDAGFVPNDYQVGQTGKVVAPDLYIAIGISGAIQHVAGIKDAKVIVAVNQDPDAPIFQVADYGLVGDLFVLLPELIEALAAVNK